MGKIVSRLEEKGLKNVSIKLCSPGQDHFKKHYADLKSKPFFNDLVKYASSGPVCAMVWEGDNSVATVRKMLGETKP
jgi:nucleoside-diphosphate kinase